MSELPKLKLKKPYGYPFEEIRDCKQAQYFLFNYGTDAIVMVEGQVITSYEELLQLATRDCYKDRDSLEVVLLPAVIGGG